MKRKVIEARRKKTEKLHQTKGLSKYELKKRGLKEDSINQN